MSTVVSGRTIDEATVLSHSRLLWLLWCEWLDAVTRRKCNGETHRLLWYVFLYYRGHWHRPHHSCQ